MRLIFKCDLEKGPYARIHNENATTKAYLDGEHFLTFWPVNGEIAIRIQLDKSPDKITKEEPCTWRWGILTPRFDSVDEAKAFVKKKRNEIYGLLATDIKARVEKRRGK